MRSDIKLGVIAHHNKGMLASFFERLAAEEAEGVTAADNETARVHRETHDAIARNDGGIDPQSMAARLIAREYGFDGDDTNSICNKLNGENGV